MYIKGINLLDSFYLKANISSLENKQLGANLDQTAYGCVNSLSGMIMKICKIFFGRLILTFKYFCPQKVMERKKQPIVV